MFSYSPQSDGDPYADRGPKSIRRAASMLKDSKAKPLNESLMDTSALLQSREEFLD